MKQYKGLTLLIFLMVLMFLATGCGSAPTAPSQATAYLTVTDDAGRTVTLTKKPERIVPLSISYVDLLYAVGGKAAGRPGYQAGDLPEEARKLPEVGHFANINTEALLAVKPDLVIGYQGMHEKLVPLLESSSIPVLIVKMKTYEDVQEKIKLFGALAGTQVQAAKLAEGMRERIAAVTSKLPATTKKAALLHVTPGNVTVLLDDSIAGNVSSILKIRNLASRITPASAGLDSMSFSMEKIVEGDPDIILITYMGSLPDIEKRLRAEVESSPAWNGLRAVKNKEVHFLSMKLFLLNPGVLYDEAVSYLAKVVYPEVYGTVNKE